MPNSPMVVYISNCLMDRLLISEASEGKQVIRVAETVLRLSDLLLVHAETARDVERHPGQAQGSLTVSQLSNSVKSAWVSVFWAPATG